ISVGIVLFFYVLEPTIYWCDIALPKDLARGTRVRSLGVNSSVTGFGTEYDAHLGILNSSIKAWNCAAAELLGRLIINPDNEPSFNSTAYQPLMHKLQLYNLVEVNMDCRLKLASERWAIDRLLKVIKTPHPVPEVCRKAAMILENLVSEPQNRGLLLRMRMLLLSFSFMMASILIRLRGFCMNELLDQIAEWLRLGESGECNVWGWSLKVF
uniref:Uncharacterized protein n=2 Tax=Brassica oleracea TaxID=3712 RepID=A0A0D3DRY7_BRAOL